MRVLAVVAAALLLVAGLIALPAAPALAAAPTVVVHRTDPLMTDPMRVEVDVLDADDAPVAFTGTVALAVGRTKASGGVAGTGGGIAVIPTAALTGGSATLTARITVAGATRTIVLKDFAVVEPSLQVAGFGCAAVTPAGGTVRWAVSRLNGVPIIAPATRDRVPRLPYIAGTGRLLRMTAADGSLLTTTGRMTVLSGSRTVGTVALKASTRRLLFSVRWRGAAVGTYTARLVLRDATGRTTTAQQTIGVVAKGATPCV